MLSQFVRMGLVGIVALGLSSAAFAVPVNHGNFMGAAPGEVDFLQVTEDSATDATPLYDTPTHLTNRLKFFPLVFASSSADGSSDTTRGVLTMTVRADAGYFLDRITLAETGDYTLLDESGRSRFTHGRHGVIQCQQDLGDSQSAQIDHGRPGKRLEHRSSRERPRR